MLSNSSRFFLQMVLRKLANYDAAVWILKLIEMFPCSILSSCLLLFLHALQIVDGRLIFVEVAQTTRS